MQRSFLRWVTAFAVLFANGAGADPAFDHPMFHGNRQRTGWNPLETILTPASVSSRDFGKLWDSPAFDWSNGVAPHMYAAPLYLDDLAITRGPYAGGRFGAVIAATSNDFVYAVNAFAKGSVPAGAILWKRRLGQPSGGPDGVLLGVLGTPAVDTLASPPRLYVAADVADATRSWRVFALDLGSGNVLAGWPLEISDATVSPINENGPAQFQRTGKMSQRGALNLSLDRTVLYVPFGSYIDGGAGWLVAVDTGLPSGFPRLASAFSGAPWMDPDANAGMWSAGGAALDANGVVYITTGNGPKGPLDRNWGNSILAFAPSLPLRLQATYTPWNHCQLDGYDVDMAGGGPVVLPDLDRGTTLTPHLLASGGKQGNAYLIDRDNMGGRLDHRPDCNLTYSAADRSLFGPELYSHYGNLPGPLNLFGPYSEEYNDISLAKARSTPAFYRAADETPYLFFTGSTKKCVSCADPASPGVARVKLIATTGQPAYLALDAYENTLVLTNPGSPVVSSNGPADPIAWLVDTNVDRAASLDPATAAHATLYAIDALTMRVLFASTSDQLHVGGKYYHPVVARGAVFVGTDRISAFGLTSHPVDAGTPDGGAMDGGTAAAPPDAGTSSNPGTTEAPAARSGCASTGASPLWIAGLGFLAWLRRRNRRVLRGKWLPEPAGDRT